MFLLMRQIPFSCGSMIRHILALRDVLELRAEIPARLLRVEMLCESDNIIDALIQEHVWYEIYRWPYIEKNLEAAHVLGSLQGSSPNCH